MTLEDELKILREFEDNPGISQVSLANKYCVSLPYITKLLQRKEKVFKAASQGKSYKAKRNRTGKNVVIETALLMWLKEKLCQNARINGPLLKLKAEALAAENGDSEFIATEGWLLRWKKGTKYPSKNNTVRKMKRMYKGLKTGLPMSGRK